MPLARASHEKWFVCPLCAGLAGAYRGAMGQLDDFLRRWLAAGIIEPPTADRILQFEQERATPQARSDGDRPGVIEVLLYLGVTVLAVGVIALMIQNWPELRPGARVAALAVPAVLCLGGGALMRVSPEAGVQRAGQLAWMVAVVLAAGTMAVFFNEYQPGGLEVEDDRSSMLIIAASTAALALLLWVFSPRHPQILALAGATFFLAQSIGNWPDDFSAGLAGMTLLGIGVAGVALVELGLLQPRVSSQLFFGAMAIFGPYQAGFIDNGLPFEVLAFAVGGALIALGVIRGSFIYVLVGVAGLFVVLVTFIFEHFQDAIGAPLALMLSGAILIGAVLLLARFRPALRQGAAS
jgi:hypothetical protein